MSRRGLAANPATDCCLQVGVQGVVCGEHDEQDHLDIAVGVASNDDRILDLRHGFDHPIDLGSADSDSTRV